MDKSLKAACVPIRYAVRQVLDQKFKKERILQNSVARHTRSTQLENDGSEHNFVDDKENRLPVSVGKVAGTKVRGEKRDFFGRIIDKVGPNSTGNESGVKSVKHKEDGGRVWVSFHEGFSNAVKKPITLRELMESF